LLLLLRLVFFFFFFFTTPHQSCLLQATPGHYCPPSTIYRFPNPSRFRNFLLSFFLRSAQAKTLDASSGINLQKLISKFPKSPAAAAAAPPPPATVAAVLLLPLSLKNPFPLHQTSPGNSCKSEQNTHTPDLQETPSTTRTQELVPELRKVWQLLSGKNKGLKSHRVFCADSASSQTNRNWARLKLSMQLKETEKRGGAKTRREKNRLTEEQTHKTLSTYQKHHQINNPFFFPPLKNPTNN
jgi:hypothetical protein